MSETVAPPGTLLEVRNLRVLYEVRGVKVPAVDGVDLTLRPGDALGLAGESGCGKSTLALACLGLLPRNATVEGSIHFRDAEGVGAKPGRLRALRWAGISMVFQGAMSAFTPVKRVGDQVVEAILLHESVSEGEARVRMRELFEQVGIASRRTGDYPHEFSGGMRQRVMIAMALACNPPLVIADEPTTALDVMTQAQILNLLGRLREETGISLVVITHDLSVLAPSPPACRATRPTRRRDPPAAPSTPAAPSPSSPATMKIRPSRCTARASRPATSSPGKRRVRLDADGRGRARR